MRLFVVILVALAVAQARPVSAKHPDYWRPVLEKVQRHPVFGEHVRSVLHDFSAIERELDRATSLASNRLTIDVIEKIPANSGNPGADLLSVQCAISVLDHMTKHRYGVQAEEHLESGGFRHLDGWGVTVGTDRASILQLERWVSSYRLETSSSFEDSVEFEVLRMVVGGMRDAYALARAIISLSDYAYGDSAILIISPERRISMQLSLSQSPVRWTYYGAEDYEAWRRLTDKSAPRGLRRFPARDAKRASDS